MSCTVKEVFLTAQGEGAKDGPERSRNTEAAGACCLAHSRWRFAIQAHRSWGATNAIATIPDRNRNGPKF
jgi:hypothetical protein